MPENQPLVAARQRIDKWLFFARVAKSRSLAQTLISGGKVTVNGQRIAQPSVQVKPGDMVAVTLERRDVLLKVVAGGDRRDLMKRRNFSLKTSRHPRHRETR